MHTPHLKSEVHRILGDSLLNPSKATQVDIVAHSMGGLVTRAWIAGMAIDKNNKSVPYNNEVRRLITVATPHYGVSFSAFTTGLFLPCPATKHARQEQEQRMQFGSHFLWILHQKWTNTPFAQERKHALLTIVGTELIDNDGIVQVPSATLSDPDVRARYIHRLHFSISAISGIVKVDSEHETFKLVQSFLRAAHPNSPEADECNAPACQRDLGNKEPGMVLMRLVDEASHGINLHNRCVVTSMLPNLCLAEFNVESSIVTIGSLPIDPVNPGKYDITVTVQKNAGFMSPEYGPRTVTGINVAPARTTVVGEVILQKSK